jgi:hypothetical protein
VDTRALCAHAATGHAATAPPRAVQDIGQPKNPAKTAARAPAEPACRRRLIRCLAVVALARLMAEIKSEVGVLPWAADWRLAQRAIAEGRGSSGTALDDSSALGMGAGDTTEVAAAVAGGLPGSTTTRVPTRMRR